MFLVSDFFSFSGGGVATGLCNDNVWLHDTCGISCCWPNISICFVQLIVTHIHGSCLAVVTVNSSFHSEASIVMKTAFCTLCIK